MLSIKFLSMLSAPRDLNAILKHWLTMTDSTRFPLFLALGLGSIRCRGGMANRLEATE